MISDSISHTTYRPPLPFDKSTNDAIRETDQYATLIGYGFTDKGAIHVVQTSDPAYLDEKFTITAQALSNGKIDRSVSGFLTKCLDEDFKEPTKRPDLQPKTVRQRQIEEKEALDESFRPGERIKLENQISRDI